MSDTTDRTLLRSLFDAAVRAAHPDHCLPPHLPTPPPGGRVIILGGGKAAGSMTRVADQFYRERHGLGPERLGGLAITRTGYAEPTGIIRVIEAGHPMPDAAGLDATRSLMALASEATADDLVLVLLSGGASANWIAPAGDLSLADKQAVTRALLRCGAPIDEINTVRKHLSAIKGGRLAALAAPARLLTLAISDVPHDDPTNIASGPTVPDPTTRADALALIARYGLDLPETVRRWLDNPASESVKPGDPAFERAAYVLVARPADGVAAAAEVARRAGYEPVVLGADVEGEARDVAAAHAAIARQQAAQSRKVAILSGGELTVTVRGQGRGGPNQEYMLALAMALEGAPDIRAVAGDTDGTDGGGGKADDPAGAFIDPTTLARARRHGLDPAAILANNDATRFFEGLGDLLVPGPSGTNINDLRAILVH